MPFRRYSVPETVMRKYWMSREKANTKNMVDKSAQTEWRPCVVWTEASSSASVGRSASEPWLRGAAEVRTATSGRPATAPSTPSWSSTTLPPATTSAPTTSTSTSLPSTDPTRSPRPPPGVQVVCFHHGVSKSDVIIQFPEPTDSSTSDPGYPCYVEAGVNTERTPPPTPVPEETSHDVAVQTGSGPTTCSDESAENNKYCQTDFSIPPTPPSAPTRATAQRVDFSCQTGQSLELRGKKFFSNEPIKEEEVESDIPNESAAVNGESAERIKKEATCSSGNYKEYPGGNMIIPRYSAVPRTGSMVVNVPSVDNSDSELSLTDSLEDRCDELVAEWPENKLDSRLVRGEVSQAPKASQRSYISSKNTYAYFLFLSGEEGSIKEYKVPDKLKARLRLREEETKKVFGSKYKNIPKITYRKRRRIQPLVLRETESQTISNKVDGNEFQTGRRKFFASRSFDSCCDCSTATNENKPHLKKLDRSKTISSFNVDIVRNHEETDGSGRQKTDSNSKTESGEDRTPRISLTLTVPSRPKKKVQDNIDDQVAKILMESLEEIRSQKRSVGANISHKDKETVTDLSSHFIKKAEAMTRSVPGPSTTKQSSTKQTAEKSRMGAEKWGAVKRSLATDSAGKQPNIKYEEVRSKTKMMNETEKEEPQKASTVATPSQSYLKVVKDKRQYEQTSGYPSEITDTKKSNSVEDEELLRAVLKKSMQPNTASTSAGARLADSHEQHEGHSRVCELGLKFLSNEIDIDQFIAGIPLERIEQDVKRLMYKHYLGSDPRAQHSDSSYDALMKKKMVVSFEDGDKKSDEAERMPATDPYDCIHCGSSAGYNPTVFSTKDSGPTDNDRGRLLGLSDESGHLCCPHCFLTDPQNHFRSEEEPHKLEKCLSPLDKSVATAVQTVDSFLDSERLPVLNEITDDRLESILSSCVKHDHPCKYNDDRSHVGYSKFCCCKNTNGGTRLDPHKNINPPNNHSPLNKSYFSPRPVKSCIKNNLEQTCDQKNRVQHFQAASKKNPSKEPVLKDFKTSKTQIIKKPKNESDFAQPKEPLEVKVVDGKGNLLSRAVRILPDKAEKKTSKFGVNKKNQNFNKYTHVFEMIPEERNSPDYSDGFEHKYSEVKKRGKNAAATSGHRTGKSQTRSTDTDLRSVERFETPKKFVSKAVETISQKSVSTMVDFERAARHETVRKERPSESYAGRSDPSASKTDRRSVDKRKGVVVGKYRPVPDKSDVDDQSVLKTKHARPAQKQRSSDDMRSLSKGWIDFYLVRDKDDITGRADKGNANEVLCRPK